MNTFIKLSFIALGLLVAVSVHGQRAESKKYKEKIEAEMIGFLTQKLELSSEELSDADNETLLATILKAKEDIYQLDKFYQVRYGDILSAKQMIALIHAEQDFKKRLIRNIAEKRKSRREGRSQRDN